ncbi:stage III sporulation protein AF [Anaerocolumna xylanovorans]|uniref:Stage III sporulation protein AF n=1 Tax=Anaerocolumna xylanovorans DSM 12503 TaxID=1121345 RepID=A0A1M7YIW9_9FIRM|nr:stage III sporulation protein AF [Anaerocolumna xylanovorans]SHO52562.1 stage III sporulation protein AF [Anaerocolumna xylanovorans DSM 12503]
MHYIYSWVKDIIIFMVLISVMTNLMGKSSYKKYINLISGIILVILVISPFLKVFQLNNTLDYYFTTNSLVAEAGDALDMEEKFSDTQAKQRETIFAQVKEKIKTKVKELLEGEDIEVKSIKITLEEDESSSSYGDLKELDITGVYGKKEKEKEDKEKVKIDQVVIDSISIEKEKEDKEVSRNFLSPVEIKAKKVLSDFYNLKADNINISIQE